jgi:hypothetical protein
MKHVGKMKNNGAKVVVAYRTLPGDSGNCLVVGTGNLPDAWHDSIMSIVQDVSGQQANELADILAVRKFPDGQNILETLHRRGQLKKVPASGVIMVQGPNAEILLSELNSLIAQQKGVAIDQLAVNDGVTTDPRPNTFRKDDPTKTTSSSVNSSEDIITAPVAAPVNANEDLTPTELRSRADKLFKEAQVLRKQADELDPPKSKKTKQVVAEAE